MLCTTVIMACKYLLYVVRSARRAVSFVVAVVLSRGRYVVRSAKCLGHSARIRRQNFEVGGGGPPGFGSPCAVVVGRDPAPRI